MQTRTRIMDRRAMLRWAAVVLMTVIGGARLSAQPGGATPAAEPSKVPASVRLTIDYSDGFQKVYTRLPWAEGMTVMDALEAAKGHPRGISFDASGAGATAFVKKIDDVANQGATGEKKNWLYSVNAQFADKSAGVWALKAGDEIVWHFGPYDRREDEEKGGGR